VGKQGEYPVLQAQVDEWAEAYPAVDVMQELREMRQWCLANLKRRKTRRGVLKFITGWLAREQDRGPSLRLRERPPGRAGPRGSPSITHGGFDLSELSEDELERYVTLN